MKLDDVGILIQQIMHESFNSILCEGRYNEGAAGSETFEVSHVQAKNHVPHVVCSLFEVYLQCDLFLLSISCNSHFQIPLKLPWTIKQGLILIFKGLVPVCVLKSDNNPIRPRTLTI